MVVVVVVVVVIVVVVVVVVVVVIGNKKNSSGGSRTITRITNNYFWDPHISARTTQAGLKVSRGRYLTTGCSRIRINYKLGGLRN